MKKTLSLLATIMILLLCGYSTEKVESSDEAPIPPESVVTTAADETEPADTTYITETETTDLPETTVIPGTTDMTEMTDITETEETTEKDPPQTTKPAVTKPAVTTKPPAETKPPQVDEGPALPNYSDTLPDYDPTVIPKPVIDRGIDPKKPMLALTFDDGPSPHTERLLDIFKNNGGKGTFFVVGYLLPGREATLQRMVAEGHEIGNHSWNHPSLTTLNRNSVIREIMDTRSKIYTATGVDVRLVRPPYGACNDFVGSIGRELGVCFINWSVDTVDWKTLNADSVYNEVMRGAHNGAIILCHDLHKTTVDAMERVIPGLIADGYQLVTVSELMYYSAYGLSPGYLYNRQ